MSNADVGDTFSLPMLWVKILDPLGTVSDGT
jgi:hypothetical protein